MADAGAPNGPDTTYDPSARPKPGKMVDPLKERWPDSLVEFEAAVVRAHVQYEPFVQALSSVHLNAVSRAVAQELARRSAILKASDKPFNTTGIANRR